MLRNAHPRLSLEQRLLGSRDGNGLWRAQLSSEIILVIDSRATTIYGFMGAFYPLAVAAFSLRVYTRLRFSSLGKDDVALLVGLVSDLLLLLQLKS